MHKERIEELKNNCKKILDLDAEYKGEFNKYGEEYLREKCFYYEELNFFSKFLYRLFKDDKITHKCALFRLNILAKHVDDLRLIVDNADLSIKIVNAIIFNKPDFKNCYDDYKRTERHLSNCNYNLEHINIKLGCVSTNINLLDKSSFSFFDASPIRKFFKNDIKLLIYFKRIEIWGKWDLNDLRRDVSKAKDELRQKYDWYIYQKLSGGDSNTPSAEKEPKGNLFNLFNKYGVRPKTTDKSDVKKAYYEFCRLAHTDKFIENQKKNRNQLQSEEDLKEVNALMSNLGYKQ